MNELALFAGAGGGLLGTKLLGWRSIGYVEWNEKCQERLLARINDGCLERAPIFTDVREFVQSGAAEQYRGFADVVSAGFPCQPFSVAGKQAAGDDERDMWPATRDVIRIVRPRSVLLENVKGLISCGYIGTVLADLAKLGYVGKWGVLGAYSVGADHRRERVWIVAHSERNVREQPRRWTTGRMGRQFKSMAWDRNWEVALREFRRMDDGMAYRVDRTDAIRNGQVPAVVAAAWELLA